MSYTINVSPSGIVTAATDLSKDPPLLVISPVADQFGGPVEITVSATDSAGSSATSKLKVKVNAVNDPPVANPDTVTVLEDSGDNFLDVMANDNEGAPNETDQDILILGLGGPGPANGSATVIPGFYGAGGGIVYKPNANFYGTDSFTYRILDTGNPQLASEFATVTVNVSAVNDAPTISIGSYGPLSEDGQGAEPGTLPLGFIDIADDTPTGTSTSSSSVVTVDLTAGNGTFNIDAADGVSVSNIAGGKRLFGQVSKINSTLNDPDTKYTPNKDFNTEGEGFGPEDIVVTVNDNGNISATNSPVLTADATIPLTIFAVNDDPGLILSPDPVQVPQHSNSENVDYTYSGFVQQLLPAGHVPTPPDEADQKVTYALVNNDNPGLIPSVSLSSPSTELKFELVPNQVGTATITIQVNDDAGGQTLQTFDIIVGRNLPPIFNLTGNVPNSGNIVVSASSGTSTFGGFLNSVYTGPDFDSPQSPGSVPGDPPLQVIQSVSVTTDNTGLFNVTPQIINFVDPSDEGTTGVIPGRGDLFFSVVPGVSGVANVSLTVVDTGGTANGGSNTTTETFTITVGTGVPDTDPPVITRVTAGSTQWQPSFLAALGGAGGYTMPTGADQAKPLPWSNINQITIDFSEPVRGSGIGGSLTFPDIVIGGVNEFFLPGAVSHVPGSSRATLTFATPLAVDKYLVGVSSVTVTDSAGNRLDGDWQNYVSSVSGDGTPGGDFLYRLNVLPGDYNQDGVVSIFDLGLVGGALFSTPANSPPYSTFVDGNGDGVISIFDIATIGANLFATLPAGNPGGVPSVAAAVDSVFGGDDDDTVVADTADDGVDTISADLVSLKAKRPAFVS